MADPTVSLLTGDIVEVRLNTEQYAQRFVNVMHYRVAGTSIPSAGWAALAYAGNWLKTETGAWCHAMQQTLVNALYFSFIDLQKIKSERYLYRRVNWGNVGTDLGDAAPQNVFASITKQTVVTTRHGRGRMEVPGLPISFVGAGILSTSGTSAMAGIASTIPNNVNLVDGGATYLEPVIYNRAAGTATAVIVNTTVQETVRVAHRRTVRVGI